MKPVRLDCYPLFLDAPRLVPALAERDWMDATPDRFAYRCTPLAIANASGWELHNPVGLTARWNGGAGKDDISVEADDGSDLRYVSSHFANGILTFQTGYLFQTDPGWVLWCRGSPNRLKDGIGALDGIIETNWSPFTFTMNWRFTRPGAVRFEAGEPFCFITLWPSVALEATEPRLMPLEANPTLKTEYDTWSGARNAFNDGLAARDPDALKQKWQRFYLNGRSPTGTRQADGDHRIKRRLKEPRPGEASDDAAPLLMGFVRHEPPSIDEATVLALTAAADGGGIASADGRTFEGNETTLEIIALIDGTRTLGDIVDVLMADFDVERQIVLDDATALARMLVAKKIAVVVRGAERA